MSDKPRAPQPKQPKPPPGSLAAQRALAERELDEVAASLADDPLGELALLFGYVVRAVDSAAHLAMVSRQVQRVSISWFVGQQVRLAAAVERVHALPGMPQLWDHWPNTPGTCLGPDTAWDSALHTALRFADRVYGGSRVWRMGGGIRNDHAPTIPVAPEPDQRIVRWCDRTMEQLQTRTLEPPERWPTVAVRRDYHILLSHIREEHRRALAAGGPGEPSPAAQAVQGGVEERVRDSIRKLRAQDKPIRAITRDGIAARLGLSGATVSGTRAWKALAREKRQQKAPPPRRRQRHAPSNIHEAIERGDWDEVLKGQQHEQDHPTPDR